MILGCTIDYACNYNPEAEYQDPGSCEFESCLGCMNENACNFDPDATLPDDNCEFAELFYDCGGNCENPSEYFYLEGHQLEGEVICEELVVFGCTDPLNPAYNPGANVPDEDDCLVGGCMLPYACNFDPSAEYLLIETCDFDSCAGCMTLRPARTIRTRRCPTCKTVTTRLTSVESFGWTVIVNV